MNLGSRQVHPVGATRAAAPNGHSAHVEAFWTIVSYAVVLGIPAFAGYVFYWFVLIPRREAEERPPDDRPGPQAESRSP